MERIKIDRQKERNTRTIGNKKQKIKCEARVNEYGREISRNRKGARKR